MTQGLPSPRSAIEFQNPGAVIRLNDQRSLIIGRSDKPVDGSELHTVRHRGLMDHHAALTIVDRDRVQVENLCPQDSSVFVNGRPMHHALLLGGDVLQIGPLAWRLDSGKQVLVPVSPIAGFDLAVDAEVPGRLTRTRLTLHRGQMTALVGPSGCGKSTLLETIRDGSGLVGQLQTAGRVYFVPQRDLVHHDLRLGDALRAIGRIYGRQLLPFEIDAALDSVGLSPSSAEKFPGQLSGGQLRRFRIAGALLSGAGVIVLDEPDSGLDHETADEVISLLRSLAIRGATIIAVTHHRHVLAAFDRVITMQPTEGGGAVETDDQRQQAGDAEAIVVADHSAGPLDWNWRRLPVLLRREQQKLTSPRLSWFSLGSLRLPHCLIGWLLVPLLFAVAVAVSVPTDPERDLADGLYGQMAPIARLGFLAVVSVIWMSASQSHLSITRDRELYDYERSYGLSWGGILTAKSAVLTLAGFVQTVVFAALLYLIRHVWLQRSFFVDERITQLPGVVLVLLVVSLAATLLGLLISAVAGRAPLVATAILPVVMMFQILFSAPFAVSKPDRYEPLADYGQLTIQIDDSEDSDPQDDWEDEVMDSEKPLWVTSLVSYTTLSRFGDQWLRSFAVTPDLPEKAAVAQRRSAVALLVIAGVCFVSAWFVLLMQSTRIGVRRLTRVAAVAGLLAFAVAAPAVALGQQPADQNVQGPADDAGQAGAGSPPTTIRLSIIDGRYDENQLRRAMGGHAEDTRLWREFGNQDRIGLVALELVGKIRFTLTERELTIELMQTPHWDLMKRLAPPRLIGADAVPADGDVVLFVHGLEGGASTFVASARELRARGIASMRFDYPNDGPPDQVGRLLAEQLIEFQKLHPGVRIHIVAHSLGGLVATWAVTEPGFPADLVPDVFTLGSPFHGSALAEFHDELELFDVAYRLATQTPGALDTIADGRGEAARALIPGSEFLRRLHQRPRPVGIRFHLAAGTKSFIGASRRERLALELPAELMRLTVAEGYSERLQKLLAADELRQGRGDGAVTVRSALGLSDPASSTSFPLSHTGLVSDTEPLEWVLSQAKLGEPVKPQAK
ncbi:alpha/beta fold hydrolase [Stieleria sp. TO1_6]|uniref:ATP-binding cassette domain-containing protein n=1 Tax=Stieleria tagensis TaxID=2956795 RepID=UPI00209B388F|nr:AAA family ATPase [Stieleria tagensis]MCO8120171.1 alpha/beta fold hydrolase [Stieleria tagensis]